jgi:heme-degrading monooxygenase HmoA
MYARSTTFRGDPQNMDEGMAYVRDTVMPAVQGMDGCVGLSMLVDRDTGRCIVTTSWADHQAMMNSAEGVRSMRDRGAEILGGEPEVQEWEIAILHRAHETADGACCRVTWVQADPANMDRVVDTFRMAIVPRVDELPGFCSMSMMIDRTTGRGALASSYDSREAMEASRGAVQEMREQFAREMDLEVTDMAEFDLALAHLRVPETV